MYWNEFIYVCSSWLKTVVTFLTPPCWQGVEYDHLFPSCRLWRLKDCPNGSASTAWDYAGLLCSIYWEAGPKRCDHSQNLSCPIPSQPLLYMVQHVTDWVASFPRSQHSPPPPLKFLHTPLPSLCVRELGAIIIIITQWVFLFCVCTQIFCNYTCSACMWKYICFICFVACRFLIFCSWLILVIFYTLPSFILIFYTFRKISCQKALLSGRAGQLEMLTIMIKFC